MTFKSINPYNNELIAEHQALTDAELSQKLKSSESAFATWRKTPIDKRARLIGLAGQTLKERKAEYAKMITLEMGKPIEESKAEIDKCAWVCEYYATHAEAFLKDEFIETDASQSFVKNEPLGTVFAVMPWNFPFWQAFRFAAPTLAAGNTALLKHSSNVFGCGKMIEDVFVRAGFPNAVFLNLVIDHDQASMVIKHDAVKAISLTGSGRAGSKVAEEAGKNLKKTLLELGGNNAFIVWEDADLDDVIETAVDARMKNSGQSCIAAKRFILVGEVYDTFVEKFTKAVTLLKSGDPMDEDTQLGTLARKDLADKLNQQIVDSVEMGANIIFGGNHVNCYHEPTILGDVTPGMPAFDEETFGPLAAMIRAKDIDHAFELSEQSKFGLGVTVCTTDIKKALSYSDRVSDGAYFVNELVKSDPRLPFGGTKESGYGRELGKDGIMEFVNRKTIYVK